MARADYGSWSKFNNKIVTEKEQLEIIKKVKKADNINYYADAVLSLCDGKYILSYFKGYYFTFHVFNGESYDYISEDSIIKIHTADMNDYKYQNKGVKEPFIYENEDIILKIYYLSSFEKPAKYFMHHLCKYEFIDKHTNNTWISIGGYGYGEGFTTWEGEHDEEGLRVHKEAYEKLENLELLARPRFSSTGFYGKLIKDKNKIYFKYNEENAHNAKGQHIVFFYDGFVLGGGEIK